METDVNTLVLLQEIRELRRQIEEMRAASGRALLALTADRERPLLGQPVTLTARLTDGGVLRAGAELVLTTTWGRLRPPDAVEAAGAALALRTGPDGTARAVLVPRTTEEPAPAQTEALLASLAGIDAAAPTPDAAREGLEALARQYRWEPSRELRGAVDLLFRERREGLADAINPAAPLAAWPEIPAAVTVFSAGTDGAVEAMAVAHLEILDWLPAWYAVHLDVSRADPALEEELERVHQRGETDADGLLDQLYDRVHWYVAGQRGLAGATVGRKVAEDSLRGFAERRLVDLPAATRAQVFQGVQAASHTLAVAGPAVLAGVVQARQDARRQVSTRLGSFDPGRLVEVVGRLDGIEGRVVEIGGALQTKADVAEVRTLREETRRDLDAKLDTTTFDVHQRAVNTNFGALQGRVSGFTAVRPNIVFRRGGGT